MNIERAKKLFAKYINNECSKEENQLLDAFLDSYQGENNTWSDLNIGNEDLFRKTSWERVESQINNDQKKKRYPFVYYLKYAVAASVILIASLTIYLNKGSDIKLTEPTIVDTNIQPGTDKAVLTLGDGSQIALKKDSLIQTKNASINGKQIVYKKNQDELSSVTYNYLTIPSGGQYSIVLSDDTKVWLNSETQLKYPVKFIKGRSRQVELVYGEAYFDVSPSSEHGGADFKVFHNNHEVQVLGTEFNLKSYQGETNIYTTLVEGKVAINYEDKKFLLKPNQQSNFNSNDTSISISEVDVYNETSWKDGIFSFERKPLKEIMVVLSRWYDIENVVFTDKTIEDKKFFGVLRKNQKITDILEIIKEFEIIESYEIKDKTII